MASFAYHTFVKRVSAGDDCGLWMGRRKSETSVIRRSTEFGNVRVGRRSMIVPYEAVLL